MIGGVIALIKSTAELVDDLREATGEQDAGIGQISRAVIDLEGVVSNNAEAAQSIADSVTKLERAATVLTNSSATVGDAQSADRLPASRERTHVVFEPGREASGLAAALTPGA